MNSWPCCKCLIYPESNLFESCFTGEELGKIWYLTTIGSQLRVEAAGKSLSNHPGVGGQGLGVDTGVQDGGVLRGECLAVARQGESRQAADGETLMLPGQAEKLLVEWWIQSGTI